jgi:hypothetical protein
VFAYSASRAANLATHLLYKWRRGKLLKLQPDLHGAGKPGAD